MATDTRTSLTGTTWADLDGMHLNAYFARIRRFNWMAFTDLAHDLHATGGSHLSIDACQILVQAVGQGMPVTVTVLDEHSREVRAIGLVDNLTNESDSLVEIRLWNLTSRYRLANIVDVRIPQV